MSTWRDLRLIHERRKDIERSLERQRLIDEAREAQPHRRGRLQRVYDPVMARVGGVLMTWGARLQERYGEFAAAEDHLAAELEMILHRKPKNAEGGSFTATT